MCKVTLPTVESFLLLYSLRVGCITIFIWTVLRSVFSVIFYVIALLEVFTEKNAPVGPVLVTDKSGRYTEESFNFIYYSYIALLLGSAMLLVFCSYLAVGLYYDCSKPLEQYLICRFITWMIEVVFLFILCLEHRLLIGWYLGMLLFTILEFYSFIVVYSYYANVVDYEMSKMCSMRSQTSYGA